MCIRLLRNWNNAAQNCGQSFAACIRQNIYVSGFLFLGWGFACDDCAACAFAIGKWKMLPPAVSFPIGMELGCLACAVRRAFQLGKLHPLNAWMLAGYPRLISAFKVLPVQWMRWRDCQPFTKGRIVFVNLRVRHSDLGAAAWVQANRTGFTCCAHATVGFAPCCTVPRSCYGSSGAWVCGFLPVRGTLAAAAAAKNRNRLG
jgi:hypothetical protein